MNRYEEVASALPPTVVSGVEALPQPHSSYVGLLVEQGVVGFLPLVAVFLAAWWLVRRLRRAASDDEDAMFAACVAAAGLGYAFMSLTLTMLPYGTPNTFLAILLGAAAARLDLLRAGAAVGSPLLVAVVPEEQPAGRLALERGRPGRGLRRVERRRQPPRRGVDGAPRPLARD